MGVSDAGKAKDPPILVSAKEHLRIAASPRSSGSPNRSSCGDGCRKALLPFVALSTSAIRAPCESEELMCDTEQTPDRDDNTAWVDKISATPWIRLL